MKQNPTKARHQQWNTLGSAEIVLGLTRAASLPLLRTEMQFIPWATHFFWSQTHCTIYIKYVEHYPQRDVDQNYNLRISVYKPGTYMLPTVKSCSVNGEQKHKLIHSLPSREAPAHPCSSAEPCINSWHFLGSRGWRRSHRASWNAELPVPGRLLGSACAIDSAAPACTWAANWIPPTPWRWLLLRCLASWEASLQVMCETERATEIHGKSTCLSWW